jgi:hypothetical protein
MTSFMTSESIVLRLRAQPKVRALKQILLMFRGIPSLCRAINANAELVKIGSAESYPAMRNL